MGTDYEPVKPTLSRNVRGKLSRTVINKTIPAILRFDARARRGVEAAELIFDPPPADTAVASPGNTPTAIHIPNHYRHSPRRAHRAPPQHSRTPFSPPIPPAPARNSQHGLPLRPGGGVLSGATSQEETLCRRTTLYPSLRDEFYRLPEVGGVYTPDVLVFNFVDGTMGKVGGRRRRESREELDDSGEEQESQEGDEMDQKQEEEKGQGGEGELGFVKVDEWQGWFYVDIVTAAMLRFPDTITLEHGGETKNVYAEKTDREMAVRKMRAVMRILRAKGVTQFVLGAWGCGAYEHPVGEVAKAWRKVLLGGKAHGSKGRRPPNEAEIFDDIEVVFAIKDERMGVVFAKEFGCALTVMSDDRDVQGDTGES